MHRTAKRSTVNYEPFKLLKLFNYFIITMKRRIVYENNQPSSIRLRPRLWVVK